MSGESKSAKGDGVMATFYNTFVRRQNLGLLTTILGGLGLVFCWWVPAGMILAMAGLVLGAISLLRIRREASGSAWVYAGLSLSIAALVLDLVVAMNGWAVVWLRAYR
jgi:hypothetical protein